MSMNEVIEISKERQKVTFLFYTKSNSKDYWRVFAIDHQQVLRPVTFKVSQNIKNYLKLGLFNQTHFDSLVWEQMASKKVTGWKTIDIILDKEIDPQEILDIMLTFVESTIQKKNSGGNWLNKNITMRELIAVVKILSYFQLTQFEEDLLVNIISHKIEK